MPPSRSPPGHEPPKPVAAAVEPRRELVGIVPLAPRFHGAPEGPRRTTLSRCSLPLTEVPPTNQPASEGPVTPARGDASPVAERPSAKYHRCCLCVLYRVAGCMACAASSSGNLNTVFGIRAAYCTRCGSRAWPLSSPPLGLKTGQSPEAAQQGAAQGGSPQFGPGSSLPPALAETEHGAPTRPARVLGEASAKVISKMIVGRTYKYVAVQNGWSLLRLPDGRLGWVAGRYLERPSNQH